MRNLAGAFIHVLLALGLLAFWAGGAAAAPYAAVVMDARTGKILHSRSADRRLHPASLTKMLTLYIAFEAVENGEIDLDATIKISRNAANERPARIGFRIGQRITLRYLIRAAAVKSANDAATAIAEAISGSEAAFIRRMNKTAKALGMRNSTFKNAHGLTQRGHLSTARDMTILGRRLLYDYPEYYNLFSRSEVRVTRKRLRNTNLDLLRDFRGADGIKTGFTHAAGYNLVASAQRGNERIIATVFGGRSSSWRNRRVKELLIMGFRRAPTYAQFVALEPPHYLASAVPPIRPKPRPLVSQEFILAMSREIDDLIANGGVSDDGWTTAMIQGSNLAPTRSPRPGRRYSSSGAVVAKNQVTEMRIWGINLGIFDDRDLAESRLAKIEGLGNRLINDSVQIVIQRSEDFEANALGFTLEEAKLACAAILQRNLPCRKVKPNI